MLSYDFLAHFVKYCFIKLFGASEISQQVKVIAMQACWCEFNSWSPQRKERTHSRQLSSDLHMCAVARVNALVLSLSFPLSTLPLTHAPQKGKHTKEWEIIFTIIWIFKILWVLLVCIQDTFFFFLLAHSEIESEITTHFSSSNDHVALNQGSVLTPKTSQ